MSLTDERIKEIAKESLRSVDIHPSIWWFVADAIRQALKEAQEWRDMESAPKTCVDKGEG